jgi:hypothetical protein
MPTRIDLEESGGLPLHLGELRPDGCGKTESSDEPLDSRPSRIGILEEQDTNPFVQLERNALVRERPGDPGCRIDRDDAVDDLHRFEQVAQPDLDPGVPSRIRVEWLRTSG